MPATMPADESSTTVSGQVTAVACVPVGWSAVVTGEREDAVAMPAMDRTSGLGITAS
jgi:hypothetical protein